MFEHFRKGQNVACLGQSNYGKSLAYNLPILAKVDPQLMALQALIICDSSTQADITAKECRALGRHVGISIGSSPGTASSAWPQILVCTATSIDSSFASIIKEQSLHTIFLIILTRLTHVT